MEEIETFEYLEKKLNSIAKYLLWVPPVIACIGIIIVALIKWTFYFSATAAILCWFGSVLILLYRSSEYIKQGVNASLNYRQLIRLVELHQEMLNPISWVIGIAFIHALIIAAILWGLIWIK